MYSPEELRKMADEHSVTRYAQRVAEGELDGQVCKWERLACIRHLKDLERSGTDEFPFVFDATRADRVSFLQPGTYLWKKSITIFT